MPERTRRFGLGRIVLDATAVARSRGDRRVGTDHLVVAVLTGAGPIPAEALGIDRTTAYETLCELDRQALAAIGVAGVEVAPVPTTPERRRLPLTPGALAVFTGMGKLSRGERTGVKHVVLSLLARRPPDPAAVLLDALHIDRTQVRARLAVT